MSRGTYIRHTRVTRCWQCSTTHIKVDNELYTLVVHFGFFCSMTHAYIKVDNNGFCALCEMTPSSHRYDIYHAGKGTTLHTHAHPHARTHTHDSLWLFHDSCTANPAWSDIFECCFKAQSSKLERLFSLKRCTRGVGAFENVTQVGLAVYRGPWLMARVHSDSWLVCTKLILRHSSIKITHTPCALHSWLVCTA